MGSDRRIGWRAIWISLLIIPLNSYWIAMAVVWGQVAPTKVSLFVNVVFILFVLTLLNHLVGKVSPRIALSQRELIVIYIMLCLGSAVSGGDMIRLLVPILGYAFWSATPENEWADLFHRYVPDWFAVKNKRSFSDLFSGESSLYINEHLTAWWKPFLAWSGFTVALLLVMLGITLIIRRQWIENEKLSYPVIQLPAEMSQSDGRLFKNKLMWIGFAVAGGMDILNGLHFLNPAIPSTGGPYWDIGLYITDKPWSAIGRTPVGISPFAIGLGFLMPLDLSLSCWFFYLLWKFQLVIGDIMGLRSLPRFPYIPEQSFGAYVGVCALSLWISRRHLAWVFRQLFSRNSNDSGEPVNLRYAFVMLGIGLLYLIIFCHQAGMSLWLILIFFAMYFTISTAIARIRAEVGSPVHDLHFIGPDEVIPKIFGTRRLGGANLTILSYMYWFNRAYRSHPMPHQLEGFKLAQRVKMNGRRVIVAMLLAVVVGTAAGYWARLNACYGYGSETYAGSETFNRLQRWLYSRPPPDWGGVSFIAIGLLSALVLMIMRMQFIWWPLHPAGFAVSGSWSMGVFWFSLLVSWAVKILLLRLGGLKAYRQAVPFFLGLILGGFVIGSCWSILGIILQRPMYRFLH
ncbi:DUF6785 family protein [Candidatus Poribacteria bacterium]